MVKQSFLQKIQTWILSFWRARQASNDLVVQEQEARSSQVMVLPNQVNLQSPQLSQESDQGVLEFVQCASFAGLHRMAYRSWGDPTNPKVLLCVHGLTRRGSDFDVLAKCMSKDFRVVCPDVVGRGDSDYLSNPMLYGVPQYVSDMVTLIARLNPRELHWFGTSMGGLIGMVLAGLKNQPIERLLLNDVGPRIEVSFLGRLLTYLGKPVDFATQEEAITYANSLTVTFGKHSQEQLRALNSPQVICKDGRWVMHYDPQIAIPFAAQNPLTITAGEQALWQSFEQIRIKTLVVRGVESDLLSASTVTQMCERNPLVSSIEVPEAGHAPAFILPSQIQIAQEFFRTS